MFQYCIGKINVNTCFLHSKEGSYYCLLMLHSSCHIVMGNLFFSATLQPQLDHTYSCTSYDSTNSGGVHVGTQISHPVLHAKGQTHDMVSYCFLFNNHYSTNCSVLCCLQQLFLHACPFQGSYLPYLVGSSFSVLSSFCLG